jgi:3',5'-cyclic AMP phosphodiesterase CpdA
VPGPGNDPKDPFAPVGLDVPWRWVMGNHDVLVQGNFTIETREAQAVGDDPTDQTRDWSQIGGPLFAGPVAVDENRDLLNGTELLDIVRMSGDGHGISEEVAASGKANYTFDVDGTPLRFIVVDTAAQTGAATGLVRQIEVDAFLRPALDDAEAAGKWVILASHHASGSLGSGAGLGGMEQPDPLLLQDWQALLGEYDNVLAHLCGHSHVHQVLPIAPPGGYEYWEVITSAIADHPHQMRVIEIRDEDNGFVTMTATAFDFSTEDDPLSSEFRERGITDVTSGWNLTGEGTIEDRNVRLWIPVE